MPPDTVAAHPLQWGGHQGSKVVKPWSEQTVPDSPSVCVEQHWEMAEWEACSESWEAVYFNKDHTLKTIINFIALCKTNNLAGYFGEAITNKRICIL